MQITRSGFALPATIFCLTALGIISAAGFLVSWMEVQIVRSHEAGTRAHHAADAGVATVLGRAGRPPATRTITLTGGEARVRSETILDVDGHGELVLIESTGAILYRGTLVTRTVSQVVWVGSAPSFDAALAIDVGTGPASVSAGTASGYVTGFPAGCSSPPGAGVSTAGPVTAAGVAFSGAPAIHVPGPLSTATARTGLRWADLLSGATPPPDAIVPPDPWPPAGSGWPHIRLVAPGPLGPGHSGRGVIVATGDLELANGFGWTGLILVGGALRLFGDVDLRGAVFAGLDDRLPSSVDLGTGLVTIEFDPCAAAMAARSLEPYPASMPGTWRESW